MNKSIEFEFSIALSIDNLFEIDARPSKNT